MKKSEPLKPRNSHEVGVLLPDIGHYNKSSSNDPADESTPQREPRKLRTQPTLQQKRESRSDRSDRYSFTPVTTKLYIKYMVSLRCKLIVKAELNKLGLQYLVLDLGMVEILDGITESQRLMLKSALLSSGLDLLDDNRSILIEKIKNVITEMVHYSDELPKVNYSDYISEKLNYDYTYLANIFSEMKGITIQQFIILHKIERVKELLLYDELNLTEISYKMHYSSVAHLSNQFKKITGLSPSYFKQMKQMRKGNLENM